MGSVFLLRRSLQAMGADAGTRGLGGLRQIKRPENLEEGSLEHPNRLLPAQRCLHPDCQPAHLGTAWR